MCNRATYRLVLLLGLSLPSLFLLGTNVGTGETTSLSALEAGESVAGPRSNVTVVTGQDNDGAIVAISPDGTVLYSNDTYDGYWDVDPSPAGRATVVYVASAEVWPWETACRPVNGEKCVRQVIERVNLSTGAVTRLYSRIQPQYDDSEWHDVDRVTDSTFVVADMYADEVSLLNVSTGIVDWEWNLESYRGPASGGPYPADWAHLNDVEILPDGRIMVSLRNHDQVVFLDRRSGVVEDWTLGSDGKLQTLYEQHNPDYVPPTRGGPAVVVADSENNRVAEYQRRDGEWNRTWTWTDTRMQWPRDADRLPNGHTLITDTHGRRILEVNREGKVVWTAAVPTAYEAERLGTGDESAGGPSAAAAGLVTARRTAPREAGLIRTARHNVERFLPSKVVNAYYSAKPGWWGFDDSLASLVALLSMVIWSVLEVWWSPYSLRWPIVRR